MKSCPRCNLPRGDTEECQHCGYVFDKPTLKKSKKNIYIIFLVLLILLGVGGYTAYNNIVSPYLNKLAEDKKKQKFIKAGKEDIKNCKNAYLAFKKIEALLESGVNFNEYSKILGNAKYELNILKVNSKRSDLLKIIYNYYNRAKDIWTARLDNDYERMHSLTENIRDELETSPFYQTIKALKEKDPGSNYRKTYLEYLSKDAQQYFWVEASKGIILYEKMDKLIEIQ